MAVEEAGCDDRWVNSWSCLFSLCSIYLNFSSFCASILWTWFYRLPCVALIETNSSCSTYTFASRLHPASCNSERVDYARCCLCSLLSSWEWWAYITWNMSLNFPSSVYRKPCRPVCYLCTAYWFFSMSANQPAHVLNFSIIAELPASNFLST